MMTNEFSWTRSEKVVARRVYDSAYERECTKILNKIKEMIVDLKDPKDIWKIEDYLEKKRIEVNAKYDYRYSVLIGVLGRLMKEKLVTDSEIQELDQDKITAIRRISSSLYKL